MPFGDLSRLAAITPERAKTIRARVLAARYGEREPLPPETTSTTLMPEELRVPLVRWSLERDIHPAAGLALLFQHLLPVHRAQVERALGADAIGWLVDAGLIAERDGTLEPRFRLVVADDVFIWCDEANAGPDAVMTPGPTTADLIALIPTPVGGSVLDIGTGPGTLALVAARRGATRVVATDISERAIALTRFNAAFNEIPLEVRLGDLYAPVSTERFDWIMAQPPYVTHPADEPGVTFLHGGAMGDELAMAVLEGVDAHLRKRGVAMVLFDSPVRPDASLEARVRGAVGPNVDVATFSQPGLHPDRQALGYASLADPTFGRRYEETAVRYRAHLHAKRISEVTHSLVVVRAPDRREHAAWTAALTVARFPEEWSELSGFMRGIDLAATGEDALATARVRPRPGAMIVIEREPGAARDRETRSIRFATANIALDRELTQAGGVIFDLLAAESSVASAIDRFAAAMERPPSEVRPLVTSFVRDCLVRALLVPD